MLAIALVWSLAAAVASIRVFVAHDGEEAVGSRHAIRHAIAEAPEEAGELELEYFDSQSRHLDQMSLWHAGTAVLLGVVSVWGLARNR
jgi:hypothetical protein